ncbi:dephospho-CoA kinase-domain-containing protein [Mycena albidolilacea]|uniref:Dephospho-CoA kinase-domain-containing protein n=1 Tax=Mycena albidolilacea TaxID=1033008 RepID=A0AAD7ATG1_9AGAR|nr:dephospho-CoA kinase-domain-containing protein [Mycena albidolilacea]
MLVVGLTGGIATGKSSVSKLLKEKHIPIVDADIIARQVVEPGTPALAKIVSSFGPEILQPDGTLDRKKLGAVIFNDEAKRRTLNSIVHPAVRRALLWGVLGHWVRGHKYCILDVPLLIEGPMWKLVGTVVVVYCSADVQLERLMKRDNSSREDASSRLNSQLPIADKVAYADRVIDNSGSPADLEAHVNSLVQALDRDAGWTWRLSWVFPPWALLSAVWTLAWRALRRPKNLKRP